MLQDWGLGGREQIGLGQVIKSSVFQKDQVLFGRDMLLPKGMLSIYIKFGFRRLVSQTVRTPSLKLLTNI